MADGRIIILVDADTKGYDKAFAEMTTTARSSTSTVSSTLTNAANKLSSFGKSATKAVTLPIAAVATACGAAAVNIDTSLTNVKKTVDGTEEQYQQLKQAAIDFSKTNAVSASQILDLQSLGAQLGFNIDELDEFSRVASGLDIATDMNAEQAASEMAQFANITKMAHDDISNYGSSIVALGNNLATTESQVSSMGQRIAAAGTQTKMSQAEILGWAGAMSSLGVEAEAGGTAFSTTISTIDAAVAKGGEGLQTFAKIAGMSSQEFAASWKNSATDTMVHLLSSTASAENMTLALEEMGITGIRQSDVMKRLAGNTQLVTDAINISTEGWKKNTALQTEVDNRNASMAARFEMLKNKVTAVAEEVGTPLINALLGAVDAADPLIDGIAQAAQAFADMDEDSQRTVLTLVAVAAAIGPVTSVTGKVIKVVGTLHGGYTKLADGLKKATTQATANAGAFQRYTTMATRGNTAVVKWDKSTQSYVMTNSKVARVMAETTAGTKAQTAAQVASNTAMKAGSTVARTLGAAMKTIAPIAAISAGIAIITSLGNAFEESKKRAETFQQATTGLRDSMNAMNEVDVSGFQQAAAGVSQSTDNITKSYNDVVQAQADFATKSTETWGNINGQSAAISAFADTIGQLANKQNMSAEEQSKLAAAVAGYNELTGENVQIIDLQNGKLDTSTEKIKQNAEAWKLNAEAQALQQELVSLYTQLHDAQDQYAQAQQRTAQAQADYDEAVRNGSADLQSYKAVLDNAKQGEADAKALMDEANASIDARAQKLGDVTLAQQGTSQAIQDFIAKNQDLQASLNDIDVSGFSSALAQLGFDTANLNQVGSENIQKLASNFDGSMQSLINGCANAGIEIPGKLSDGMYKGSGGVYVAAGSIAAGVFSELTGVDYSSAGGFVSQGMAQGISGDLSASLAAAGMSEEVIASINAALGIASPSRRAAESGGQVPAGLAQGMSGSNEPQSAAETMGANVIASLIASLEPAGQAGTDSGLNFASALQGTNVDAQASGSFIATRAKEGMTMLGQFLTLGTTTGARFATGVGNTSGTARNKGNAVASASKAGMTMLQAFSSLGSTSGSNFASGVGSKTREAQGRGRDVANNAKTGMQSQNNSASSWGNHLVQNFANGIKGAISFVTGAANFIANGAAKILKHSVAKEGPLHEGGKGEALWGEHMVENFAEGMLDAIPAIMRASDSVASSLYDKLSNMDAPSVPIGLSFDTSRLSEILDRTSVAGLISGSASVDLFGKRLEAIESKMDLVTSKLDSIDKGIKQLISVEQEPIDIYWNKRELARVGKGLM